MQVDRRGVLQNIVSAVRRFDHVRMTMSNTDGHDSAECVEITAPLLVPDILHFSLHQHDWLLVVEKNTWVQKFFAQPQYFIWGGPLIFLGLIIKRWKFGCFHVGRISSCSCDWRLS